jgi:putative spermidine/putrescine transport system ATP-binding protein
MNVAGDDQFIVKVPNNSGEIDFRVGDNVFVGWQGNDCRALDYRQAG